MVRGLVLVLRRLWLRAVRRRAAPVGATLALMAISLLTLAPSASAESYEEAVEGTTGISHFWPMGEVSGSSFAARNRSLPTKCPPVHAHILLADAQAVV